MSLAVTVALIADYDGPFDQQGPLDERWYELAYAQRRQVTLEVAEDETLAGVLERAADEMGLQPPPDHWGGSSFTARFRRVAFHKPEDEDGFTARAQGRMHLGELIVVDPGGPAIFGVGDLSTVRYRDLLRTEQGGALDGDPLRPYLIIDDGWGDAPPVDWATLQQGLDVAWDVLKAAGAAYGGTQAFCAASQWVRERMGRGRDALDANPGWAQRQYRPDQFATLLEISGGEPARLAQLLGCTAEQAEAVFWTIGYAYDQDSQRWQLEADDAAVVLHQLLQATGWASHAHFQGWEQALAQWLRLYLETGQAPALESLDPVPAEDNDDFEIPMTVGERLDTFLERLRR